MAMSVETKSIDWDQGIIDALPGILQFLNVFELNAAAKVSKTWRAAAKREKAKRKYIQQTSLSYHEPVRLSMVKVKPELSLLIQGADSNFELKDVVYGYAKRRGSKVIAMKVNKYITTQDVERTDRSEQKSSRAHIFHGMFFPRLKDQAHVEVVWEPCELIPMCFDHRLFYFAEELGLMEDHRPKSTILFFTQSRKGFELAYEFTSNSHNTDNETMWACMTQEMPITVLCPIEKYQYSRCIAAVKISGPSVSSWSAEIDSSLPRDMFEGRLLELKERVTRRRHCIGLFYSPASNAYGDGYEITKNVKRIFPGIPIIGLFNSKLWSDAGAFFEQPNDEFYKHMNNMSIIIITYD